MLQPNPNPHPMPSDDFRLAHTPNYADLSRELAVGQLLLKTGVVNEAQLEGALEVHRRTGVRLGEALVALGYARADQVAEALAHKHTLDTFDPGAFSLNEHPSSFVSHHWRRQQRIVPISMRDGALQVATTDPTDHRLIAEVRDQVGCRLQPMIATNRDIEQALHRFYSGSDIEMSTRQLRDQSPENSAHYVLSTRQSVGLGVGASCFALTLLLNWSLALVAVTAVATTLHLAASAYKLYLLALGATASDQGTGWVKGENIPAIAERDLPIYTILVPLYKEGEILPQVTRAIWALDWPKAKLDVRLLLEEDDWETLRVARAARLPAPFTFVIVPKEGPRGKPKACNYGLRHARGEYVVIFDAEDIPEADQLKKAYAAFQAAGPDLACVQCRLNCYNPTQNVLTRWFTAEYSMWFDMLLPGLQRAAAPIPLGGTSNHFRRAGLEQLGAWDPYNVTEDADLGIRLFKQGLRTVVLDSTTFEEASPRLGNWVRQRSRWIKGYIQTWLVHMRHPVALWRSLGPRGFLGFQLMVGGTSLVLLLNPFYWVLLPLWFATHSGIIEGLFPGPIFYLGGIALYLGNFIFVYLGMAGAMSRRYYGLVGYALLYPVYWALMSIAAWKGCLQLFYAPSYWEKTRHNLYKGPTSGE